MFICLYVFMRTTINLEDKLYKQLINQCVERYGTSKKLSLLINSCLTRVLSPAAQPLSKAIPGPVSVPPLKIEQRKTESYIHRELEKKGGLLFAVIDPLDHPSLDAAVQTAKNADEAGCDAILIGGSTGVQGKMLDDAAIHIQQNTRIPIILFPGNIGTLTKYADAVYFMSLLNSQNPYWLSTAQMLAAPNVRELGIEPLPTGYIVVEPGGTVGHIGEANLIPRNKPKLAAALALAAQYMGFRIIITDAGSDPKEGHVPLEMVAAVRKVISVPYVVAGGIRTPEQAKNVIAAGADIVQVGTAFEKHGNVRKIREMVDAVREGAKQKKKV